ncbi:MAG: aldo/keto reductase [Treponema sp.]|nr:aldo/keto reductase [Treponema sp.]
MIYKQFKDLSLSALGFGAMRLPSTGGGYGAPIDYDKARALLRAAYEGGINYFDTSYFYHNGDSEAFLGKTLSEFPRESYHVASKLPGNLIRKEGAQLDVSGRTFKNPRELFDFQMNRVGVDYFDFFLLHNVSEATYSNYTNPDLALVELMVELKSQGLIKHLGFSSHGRADTIEKFLNFLNEKKILSEFEFAMIQMNYLDDLLQGAGKKHECLSKAGLETFVMEGLRGGKLARPGEKAEALFKNLRPHDSPSAWAFRWLQSRGPFKVILSGMSSMEQLKENLDLFSRSDPLNPAEEEVIKKVIEEITERVPCTACGYCTEDCPQHLDIPLLLSMYNEAGYDMGWFLHAAIRSLKEEEKPSACIACGACSPLCPQNIDIPKILEDFSSKIGA